MDEIILKGKTRIFRPSEVRKLIDAIPKNEYKDKFESLLYSGARYSEMKWLYEYPRAFIGNSIKIPSFKKKARHNERYIRLNHLGQRSINYFLRAKRNLPCHEVWMENLHRWAKKAGLDTTCISIRSTRKTWESWLVTQYPQQLEYIFLSQGHTQMTALKFYLMIPFNDEDKRKMKFYTDGWM
jgi:hypothetical protein